jgi:RNA polymerase sigma-70 factor (ECF subfamily)
VKGLKRSDPAAVGALYDRLSPRAFGLAVHITGDEDVAAKIIEDAFSELGSRGRQLDGAPGRVTSELLTLVYGASIDEARRRSSRSARQPAPSVDIQTDLMVKLRDSAMATLAPGTVTAAFNSLPPEERDLIELAVFEGLTVAEISEHAQLPAGTVRSRLREGIARLRDRLVVSHG